MYDEQVKLFRYCAEADCTECAVAGCPGPQKFLKDAVDSIEELSKRAEEWETIADGWQKACKGLESRMSCWIPVTERLPSPMRAVLVWTPYKHNIFMAYLQGNKWYVWGPDDSCCHNWPEYHAITHWMPLPEPPKEEA